MIRPALRDAWESVIPNFSAGQLDSELKLHERGASDGAKDSPGAQEKRLSAVEQQVVARVQGALAQQSSALLGVNYAQDYTTMPQELEILAGEPQTILAQFRASKARAQSSVRIELEKAHTDFARAYRDYRAFRIEHKLVNTEPSYDNVFWRKVFWLALLFTIEVAANGWVIGQASPGGLVQGWTTALMISVMVVLTGTLIGMGPWRYLTYSGPDGKGALHKIWAIPAVIVGGLALLLFAFYVAHYRYALSHTALDAPVPENILTSIRSHPFQPFEQLESLVLFIIALLIGVFAVARGAHWDEPYPGYGPRHRRMEEARERTNEIAMGLSREIDLAKTTADEGLNAVAQKSQDTVGGLKQAIARTQNNAAEWDNSAADIIGVGHDAIAIYRNANHAARNSPDPIYFRDDPFGQSPSSAAILDALQNALGGSTPHITKSKSELAGARAQLEAEFHSFYDDEISPFLKGIADNAAQKVHGEFLSGDVEELPAPKEPPARDTRSANDIVRLKGRAR